MADDPAKNNAEHSKESLDLNELSGLDFGPNWAAQNERRGSQQGRGASGKSGKGGGERASGKRGETHGQRERGGSASRDRRSGGPRRDGNKRFSGPPQFEPTVKVDLYPQDEAFDALIARLRSSARTYQLFDIAQLLLEKPDRFVVVLAPLNPKAGSDAMLYYSVPGHLPFETEEAAISFVVANHLDHFFEIEEIEVDPPKGNFQMVNRCTITGELIGPPNYHRYQEFLRHHYANRIHGMSFERFTSKLEGVKEPEQIEAWLESMKKGARYSVKDRKEGEPEAFDSLESARYFLLQHRKDQVVGSGESVRFAGRDIERLPKSDIRRSVEAYIEKQKVFPLESANNIRGRLRRHKFAVYKKGSKGVSFVCAVKRKFRDSKTLFTDSIRELIEFIEANPEIPASKLPKAFIGIDTERQKPEVLKMTEAEVEAAAKAKAEAAAQAEAKAEAEAEAKAEAEAAESEETQTPTQPTATDPTATAATGNAADAASATPEEAKESSPAESEVPAADATPTPVAENAQASTEAKPKAELPEADAKRLRQLMLDLRWLITEGYVTEYGDGRLFAPPPMPEPKPKEPTPKQTAKPTAKPAPAARPEGVEPTSAETKEAATSKDAGEPSKESEAVETPEAPAPKKDTPGPGTEKP